MSYRRAFQNGLLFTAVFPNIRVISSTNSFQPLTLPLILLDTALRWRANRDAARFTMVYLTCVLTSFLVHQEASATAMLYVVLYTSGPLTFFYFLDRGASLSHALINFGLAFTFATVAEQFFVASALIESLNAAIFANRPEGVEIGLRGVGGFMSEPSQSGRLYCFLLFLAYVFDLRHKTFWLALAIPFLLMNRSASAFLYLVVFLFALSYKRSKTLAAMLTVAAVLALPSFLLLELRFAEALARLVSVSEGGGDSVLTLGMIGGRRLIHTTVGYLSVLYYPWGNGIASALDSFLETARTMGFDLTAWNPDAADDDQLKPSSYAAQLLFDFGVLALPIFAALLLPLRTHRVSRDPVRLAMFALGALQILVISPTTIPWPWVMTALGLERLQHRADAPKPSAAKET